MDRTSTEPDCSLPLVRYQISSVPPYSHNVQFCWGTPLDPPKLAVAFTVAPPQVPRLTWSFQIMTSSA